MTSFLNHDKPLLTAMVSGHNVETSIMQIRNCIYDGADAIGINLGLIEKEFRSDDNYRKIFSVCGKKPIYITNYRHGHNLGDTDEQLAEGLLYGLRCGATLADVMGDMFNPSPLEITTDKTAIAKQAELVDKIHHMGKEVLISTHTHRFMPKEQVVELALEYQRRGADIVKLVTGAQNDDEQFENLEATHMLKKELKVPFLFLSNGTHFKIHRVAGPMLGCVMYLCVHEYTETSGFNQPKISSVRHLLDHFDFEPDLSMM